MNKPTQELTEQRKRACEQMLGWQFSEMPNSEQDIIREYFYCGDIKKYICDSSDITDMIVFEATPFINLEDYLENLKIYWEWVLESPASNGNEHNLNRPVSERLIGKIEYYSLKSICLPDELKRKLFFWTYGERYEADRVFPMSLGADQWQPKINMNIDWVCSRLMSCIRDYLMGYDGAEKSNANGKFYIDYFLSIYPYMSDKCFSMNLCMNRFYEENGVQINLRGFQITNRWFVAGLHNILTNYEDDENIEELVIHDEEAFRYLKEGLSELEMPAAYYEVEKFVIKHGEECLYASE